MTNEPEKVDLGTPDLAAQNIAAMKALFPGVLDDGVLDAAKLGELLDTPVAFVSDGRERYGLQWAGKQHAVRSLLSSSRGALIPHPSGSVNFDTASNVFIEGDNLEVLKLLQKAYNDKIKLIYIDPPYNTGKGNFIYNDDFIDGLDGYLAFSGQLDDSGTRRSAVTDTAGRFHSRWLNMMFPRLLLARNLLRQDGLLLVSIDDHETATLRMILAEVFGEENFLATLVWDRGHSRQQGQFKEYHEYVIAFARNRSQLSGFKDPTGGEVVAGAIKRPSRANPKSEFRFPAGVRVDAPDGTEFKGSWGGAETTTLIDGRFVVQGGVTREPITLEAAWTQKGQMEQFYGTDQEVFDTRGQRVIEFYFSSTGKLKYRKERTALTPSTVQRWGTQGAASGALAEVIGSDIFDLPKPVGMLRDFVSWATEGSDIVLDFFAGSGTTAQAVAEQNAEDGGRRRVISVNIPEPTEETSAARGAGYETVADITLARLQWVIENIEGAKEAGLRAFSLGQSNFRSEISGEDLDLTATTLAGEERNWDAIAAEVLLKEGVALDARWERHELAGGVVVRAEHVGVVLSDTVTSALVDQVLEIRPSVVVFMEDGFAGADAVKANAYTKARNAGITMKSV